jgi:hypothetical protein
LTNVQRLAHSVWDCKYQCAAATRKEGWNDLTGSVRSCMEDGGLWPSVVCLQGPASNHPLRHRSKALVVSERGKGVDTRQVWTEKTNTREPSCTCRNSEMTSKPEGGIAPG